ncbi:hypothetical protein K438DRAFT_1994297 [Mycena galopus ATCC 62051]|nr:hypothetical protein K438DRAFT_1994297 [Mycena galopus ATCC 62051]
MHSVGEHQFYMIALIETLFQHVPLKIRVGLLYDIGCAFEHISVFHAFGHEWACQLLYHPRKRLGFGFTNGESAERFWNSIRHLIAHLRICGYHNRLYTLDAQIGHSQEGSLFRLGERIRRRHRHCVAKRAESTKALRECEKSTVLLREQWQLQVVAQTKPLPRQTKNRGQQAVNAVILLRAAIKTRETQVAELRKQFLSAVDDNDNDNDAAVFQLEYDQGLEALKKARTALCRKEEALGVDEHEELEQLANSEYMRLCMNARALKLCLRERLCARKFEMDVVERSYWQLLNNSKLHAHTESAVKCRAPTIVKLAAEGSIAPVTIPPKGLWQLNVDDAIFQDVGLDDRYSDSGDDNPPLWLSDDNVRKGINAALDLDPCDEEEWRLRRENSALRVWFRQEWEIVTKAIEGAVSDVDKYHLQLHQDRLVKLAATWDKHLPDFGEPSTPWGPSLLQLSRCRVDAHLAARGEDRHYREEEDDGDDGEESGGEDNCRKS